MKIDRKAIREEALAAAKQVLGSAIEFRRNHPYRFYIFHLRMEQEYESRGKDIAAAWHRFWRRRYWARSLASSESAACAKARRHPVEN